jgi:hypothetical protein
VLNTERKRQRGRALAASALLAFCAACFLFGCALREIGAEKDVVRNGIRFESFRESDDGTKLGTLAEDTLIDGWPCKKGFIVFHPDWRLDELQLARDYERNGVFMPAGTWVFPGAAGNPGVCMFPRDVEIQGYLVRGSRAGKSGFMTQFYDSGRLRLFWSRDPVQVDGVICADSVFEGIYLHENGRLQQCKLHETTTIRFNKYDKGSVVRFDEKGLVIRPGR